MLFIDFPSCVSRYSTPPDDKQSKQQQVRGRNQISVAIEVMIGAECSGRASVLERFTLKTTTGQPGRALSLPCLPTGFSLGREGCLEHMSPFILPLLGEMWGDVTYGSLFSH